MEKTVSIKFYWNGLKVNGSKKLIKCSYSLDNNRDGSPSVSIYAGDYGASLPQDIFSVCNDTDLYTDYFDKDSAEVTPDHPLYNYARYAAMKARYHYDAKHRTYLEKSLASPERWSGSHKMYRDDLDGLLKRNADFEAATDPGQPAAEDVEKCHALRLEKENARRMAEKEAEQKTRERYLNKRCEGAAFIRETMEAHPVKENTPVIRIHWSEHPAFYAWKDDELVLSPEAADIILKTFDEQEVKERGTEGGGYFKTSLSVEENGEVIYGGCRYDLGDGDGGLFEHIRAFGKFVAEKGQYGRGATEEDKADGEGIIALADRLESYKDGGIVTSVELAPYMNDVMEQINKKLDEEHERTNALLRLLPNEALVALAEEFMSEQEPDTARRIILELAKKDKTAALEAMEKLGL
jgi:hypothetical protein